MFDVSGNLIVPIMSDVVSIYCKALAGSSSYWVLQNKKYNLYYAWHFNFKVYANICMYV
jgi:hypothetical protein